MENTTNTANTQTSPRFLVAGKECIYRLFDAFLKKVVIDDYVIDFSKPAVVAEDGSIEFASGEMRFSEILGVDANAARGANVRQPVRGRNESDQEYAKRIAHWQKDQKKELAQAKAADAPQVGKIEDPEKYRVALGNYLNGKVTDVSKEAMDCMNLALAHLSWLRLLGMADRKTSCAMGSKSLDIKENWMKNLDGYDVKDGLWAVKSSSSKNDILLEAAILYRFMTWPNRPVFKSVAEVKSALVDFIFKTKKENAAPIRNGLLHFCDPDRYIGIYSFEKKSEFVKNHETLLQDYKVSDFSGFREQDSLFFSMKFAKGLNLAPYQANRTEEKICYIFDKMNARAAG